MQHFRLVTDWARIDAAAGELTKISDHLTTRAAEVGSAPGDISPTQWSGAARNAITAEMTALGTQLSRFAPMFATAGRSLKTLAEKVRTAEEVTLPNLNRRWDEAQAAHQDAVAKANSEYFGSLFVTNPFAPAPTPAPAPAPTTPNLQKQRSDRIGAAESARAAAEGQLNREFDTLVADLEAAFKSTDGVLTRSTLIGDFATAGLDAQVARFLSSGGSGTTLRPWMIWHSEDRGRQLGQVGTRPLLGMQLPLYDRMRAVSDGDRALELTNRMWGSNLWGTMGMPPADPADLEELERLLEQNVGDARFAGQLAWGWGQRGAERIGPFPQADAGTVENVRRLLKAADELARDQFQSIMDAERASMTRGQDDSVRAEVDTQTRQALADGTRAGTLVGQVLDEKRTPTSAELEEIDRLVGPNTNNVSFATSFLSQVGQRGHFYFHERTHNSGDPGDHRDLDGDVRDKLFRLDPLLQEIRESMRDGRPVDPPAPP